MDFQCVESFYDTNVRLTPLHMKHYTAYPNFIMHYMSHSILHSSPFGHTHTHTHTHNPSIPRFPCLSSSAERGDGGGGG